MPETWTGDELTEAITVVQELQKGGLSSAQEFWLFLLKAWSENRLDPNQKYSTNLLETLASSTREEDIKTILERVNEVDFPEREESGLLKAIEKQAGSSERLVTMIRADLAKALRFFSEQAEIAGNEMNDSS